MRGGLNKDDAEVKRSAHAEPIAGAAVGGTVYLVGAGPGDVGLLTLRAAELLATADVVLHDELVHPAIVARARPGAEVRSVGKRGGDRVAKQASQDAIDRELVALGEAGRAVVRLKGGDPFLFGRGSEEAEALASARVPFEVVPGVPSPLAATAYAGISVTHRDLASSVTFVSGTTRAGAPYDYAELASVRGTICVLMGMHRLDEVTARLVHDARKPPDTPCAVIQWGTRSDQRVAEGTLETLAATARAEGVESPAIIVVGPVAKLRRALRWFDARPLFGRRVLVARAAHQASSTCDLLRARGAEPVAFPLLEIHPPPDLEAVARAVADLGSYDLVAFTSENAVEQTFAAIDRAGRDARALGAARVAAIGPGTAAALARFGVRADVAPERDLRGEALAQAIVDAWAGHAPPRVLVPRALVAREALVDALRAHGASVDVVAVYETRPASASRRAELVAMLEARRLDAILLTSGSTADHLVDLLGDGARALLDGVALASIGPVTTRAAEARGLDVALTAAESTIVSLVDALERHLAAPKER
jgi:uroporphyrinogen III methyltransferase/synthase